MFSRMDSLFAIEPIAASADPEVAALASRLPMAPRSEGGDPNSWVALMRTVAWNYHQFLEKTRA
jgi:hypothetical protein